MGRFFLWYSLPIFFLLGCSSAPKNTSYDHRINQAINSIMIGQSSSDLKRDPRELSHEDLLRNSTYLRYGDKRDLIKSSIGFLKMDNEISEWEKTLSEKIGASTSEFILYSFGNLGSRSPYMPRPFESTMLSFNLALNHFISGQSELATIEARKITQKENFIERLNLKTLEAIEEQRKIDFNLGPKAKALSKIEMIEDYPIEIFKVNKNVAKIKNSYQSAAANYLAGYIFESVGDKSLASPAYIKSIELLPNSKLFSDSLKNIERAKGDQKKSDVLFVFELGLAPKIITKKYRFDVVTNLGQKMTSIVLPTILDNGHQAEKLGNVFINNQLLSTELTADFKQILITELKDSMPKYLTMATSKALLELSSQISVSYVTKGLENTDKGLSRLLASTFLTALYSRGEIDVRTWDSLPGSIYMARTQIEYGSHDIEFQNKLSPKVMKVKIDKPFTIINIRVFDKNSFLVLNESINSNYLDTILKQTSSMKKYLSPKFISNEPEKSTSLNIDNFLGSLKNFMSWNKDLQVGASQMHPLEEPQSLRSPLPSADMESADNSVEQNLMKSFKNFFNKKELQ